MERLGPTEGVGTAQAHRLNREALGLELALWALCGLPILRENLKTGPGWTGHGGTSSRETQGCLWHALGVPVCRSGEGREQ